MEFKFKLLALLISLSLTACGGSSGGGSDNNLTDTSENSSEDTESTDTSSSDDNSSTSDVGNTTGNCVTVARPKVGQVEVMKTTDTFFSIYQETKIIAFSNTSSTTEMIMRSGSATGKITSKNTTTSTYTIANNFQDTTQSSSTGVTLVTDETGAESLQESTSVTVFSPPSHIPVNRFCEGQTWTDDYEATMTTTVANEPPSSYTIPISGIYTIEAINVSKTVTAGTFNTIQLKIEDGTSVIRAWGDIETGLNIASEQKLTSGKLFSQSELISFSR